MYINDFIKRVCCVLLACTLVFTTFSRDVKKAEAVLPALVVAPSAMALIGDVLFSLGVTFLSYQSLKETVGLLADYLPVKESDLDATGKATINYKADGVSIGGGSKSFDLKSEDLSATTDILYGTSAVAPGAVVDTGVVDVLRAFSREKLNISAIDGSAPLSYVWVTPEQYFDSHFYRVRFPIVLASGVFSSATSTVWAAHLPGIGSNYFSFISKCGASMIIDYSNGKNNQFYFSSDVTQSGYTYFNNNVLGISATSFFFYPFLPFVDTSRSTIESSTRYKIDLGYASSPSIDTSYAGAPITWGGVADPEVTVANQKAATTDTAKKEYVDKAITPYVPPVSTKSYDTLNYILDLLATHFGATTAIDVAVNDGFIADFYKTYVHGSAAEKLTQSEALINQYTVLNGGTPDDNDSNKHFKLLDNLANAYLAWLVGKALLPAGTPQIQPGTEVSNVSVVDALTETPPPPTESPDPDPGGGTSIPDWLSKIYKAIVSVPTNIVTAIKGIPSAFVTQFDKIKEWITAIPSTFGSYFNNIKEWIVAIPSTFATSDFGLWVKSIPGSLIDIKNAVLSLPDVFISKINTFLLIDMEQVNVAASSVSSAFKAKFSALDQIISIFDKTDLSFSNTVPVIEMKTPDVFKSVVKSDKIVVMDLRPYADVFVWCRVILTAIFWVAFGKWVMDQFDVDFHIG